MALKDFDTFVNENESAQAEEKQGVISYAIAAYGFLMDGPGVYTYAELAKKVKEGYDMSEDRNKIIYDVLMSEPNTKFEVKGDEN
jgi:hypothetical protein